MDGGGFEPPKSSTTDLQSAPFGRSGTLPCVRDKQKLIPVCGAGDGTRTRDLLITNQLLCQLSHVGNYLNGAYRARTYDPLLVRQMLSQLS